MNLDFDMTIRLLDLVIDAILAYYVWKMYQERKMESENEEEDKDEEA